MTSFRYILRYKIDPGFHSEERIEELAGLCRAGRIEEVMLFFPAEELSAGHLTPGELESYGSLACRVRDRLAEEGVALSLNPWTTTYHVSRGRGLREGRDFRLLVGETGAVSPITACPLCPEWQAYLCGIFAWMAREVGPVAIWVEDDWRLHNHESDQGWGGCFCEEHLRLFSARAGEPVDRVKLLDAILAPGKPHPWRREWLALSRETLLEPARKLREAVHRANPAVRLGLMTSNPDVHSAEGRDWPALQEALGSAPAFLVRPHVEPYTETPAISTPPAVTRLTLANLEGAIEVYPELENSPRCGPYSKSAAYSLWECFCAAVYGSHGMTINHFDMMGNGVALDPRFGPALGKAKDRLNALAALGIDGREAEGVQVLFHPDIAAARHATDLASLHGLVESSQVWARTLSILGIAHGYTRTVRPGQVHAVSGQTLRAYPDAELETLLSGPLLLDALSVEILLERGFGVDIGVAAGMWRPLREAAFAYEEIAAGDPGSCGPERPRMTAQRCAARLLAMDTAEGAETLTRIYSPDHRELFPGCVLFENPRGGRIATLAYPLGGDAQFFMGFFNAFRRAFLQELVFRIGHGAPLAAAEEHPAHLYRTPFPGGRLFAAFNVIQDETERVVLRLPKNEAGRGDWQYLGETGEWEPAPAHWSGKGDTARLVIDRPLRPLEGLFLRQSRMSE